jgi:hypothetical protein
VGHQALLATGEFGRLPQRPSGGSGGRAAGSSGAAPRFSPDAWFEELRQERERRIFESKPDFPDYPRYFTAESVLGLDGITEAGDL